jgi:uncharacterized protein YdhG (YjbR/CyaY superfamily)
MPKLATYNIHSNAVDDFMLLLKHPLHAEIEMLRKVIKATNKKIVERVKWNAPSYFYKNDLATIHVKETKQVLLIVHEASVVHIQSSLLQGTYSNRRLIYLADAKAIKGNTKEIKRIFSVLISNMDESMD